LVYDHDEGDFIGLSLNVEHEVLIVRLDKTYKLWLANLMQFA